MALPSGCPAHALNPILKCPPAQNYNQNIIICRHLQPWEPALPLEPSPPADRQPKPALQELSSPPGAALEPLGAAAQPYPALGDVSAALL